MLENEILSSLIEIFSEYDCESKIKEVFDYYKDYNENFIYELLNEEIKTYSEDRTLGLARLFEDAGTPIKANDLMAFRDKGILISPKTYRFIPLLFYRRAADHNSIIGCEEVSYYFNNGSSDFEKDEIKGKFYRMKALNLGSIKQYFHIYNLTLNEIENVTHINKCVGMFYYWQSKNNSEKAKESLIKIKNDLSEETRQKVIEDLEHPYPFSKNKDKYYDAAKFLKGENDEYIIQGEEKKKSFFQRLFGR